MKYVFILTLLFVAASGGLMGAAVVVRRSDNMTKTAKIVPGERVFRMPADFETSLNVPFRLFLNRIFFAPRRPGGPHSRTSTPGADTSWSRAARTRSKNGRSAR